MLSNFLDVIICHNIEKIGWIFLLIFNILYNNKQNLPTYAEAELNGKTRFMPINLYNSDEMSTEFGDENNFSLSTEAFDYKTVNKTTVNISAPDSEFLYKTCNVVKKKK
ncbi:ACP-like domain-containing protein [Moraxella oblonga]|uniref:ACP-like domain-containing protein n=1 Tax=Moraxella oblonga TaxID=200413 RepID=UPI000829BC6B|nr:hypothetical protein [Moraxella oblonga]